ncbi:hypothetical protein [Nitratireductor sp. ZSWI3]|uniref:hypothetical protein n=1 Tax=Nitratireductor sp. ZSWI3 TaxID=2966359 RepID=UPI00214FA71B|nr:hypothetical protein [Nitratireductor sp. ZSWI3]MCR4265549.1 hypothetical protein [Nitratireductor sp. ZSWI3]
MKEPADKKGSQGSGKGDGDRSSRLAAELRANLARRKAQARSRRQGSADDRPEGLGRDIRRDEE